MQRFTILIILFTLIIPIFGQNLTPYKILIVTAHPDDETGFAATVYKVTKEMKGIADQCVITIPPYPKLITDWN